MLVETVRFCRHGCKSWFCSGCAYARGKALQAEWEAAVNSWDGCLLTTLTCDPQCHTGPAEAYAAGRKNIGRLMRDLRRMGIIHSKRWVGVLECHESGWPHFHLLVEAHFIPHKVLQALWARYGMIRPTGVVDLRARKRGQTKTGMVGYVTKYLTKTPKGGWPSWITEATYRVFRVLRCRVPIAPLTELQAEMLYRQKLMPKGGCRVEPKHCGPRACRSHSERVASCGGRTVVQRIYRSLKDDGEIVGERVRFFGYYHGPRWELFKLLGLDPEGPHELDVGVLNEAWGLLEGKRWIGNPHGTCSYSSMAGP